MEQKNGTPQAYTRRVAHTTIQRPRISSMDLRARHLSDASPGSGRDARKGTGARRPYQRKTPI